MKFDTYNDLANHIAEKIAANFDGQNDVEIEFGYSNVSCSTYIKANFGTLDEDGDIEDYVGGCKVRVSDHDDRYGSDLTIRFDNVLDEDELHSVVLADWRIDEMVAKGTEFINREKMEQTSCNQEL